MLEWDQYRRKIQESTSENFIVSCTRVISRVRSKLQEKLTPELRAFVAAEESDTSRRLSTAITNADAAMTEITHLQELLACLEDLSTEDALTIAVRQHSKVSAIAPKIVRTLMVERAFLSFVQAGRTSSAISLLGTDIKEGCLNLAALVDDKEKFVEIRSSCFHKMVAALLGVQFQVPDDEDKLAAAYMHFQDVVAEWGEGLEFVGDEQKDLHIQTSDNTNISLPLKILQ